MSTFGVSEVFVAAYWRNCHYIVIFVQMHSVLKLGYNLWKNLIDAELQKWNPIYAIELEVSLDLIDPLAPQPSFLLLPTSSSWRYQPQLLKHLILSWY